MPNSLASEFERRQDDLKAILAAKTLKGVGTAVFLGCTVLAVIAVANNYGRLFLVMALGVVIGLAFRVEGAVRAEVARHAQRASEGRLSAVGAAQE
jgi:hypothetical protein